MFALDKGRPHIKITKLVQTVLGLRKNTEE